MVGIGQGMLQRLSCAVVVVLVRRRHYELVLVAVVVVVFRLDTAPRALGMKRIAGVTAGVESGF